MEQTIVVIGEHDQGRGSAINMETAEFARRLTQFTAYPVKMVWFGDDIGEEAEFISGRTGIETIVLQSTGLPLDNSEAIKTVLTDFLPLLSPAFICMGHTAQAMDYAPGLAVRLQAAHITGVQDVMRENGELLFVRGVCGGKQLAYIAAETVPVILNILPGRFKPEEDELKATLSPVPQIIDVCPDNSGKIRFLDIQSSVADHTGLTEAEVIVTAGNGIEDKENLELIFQLAELFSKSAVGGSRIICDRGWLDYGCQVGITGATVTPKLYICCGVSGASQHLAGMSGAEFIVAINTDPQAPIMNSADVCVTEDLRIFIPEFIRLHNSSC